MQTVAISISHGSTIGPQARTIVFRDRRLGGESSAVWLRHLRPSKLGEDKELVHHFIFGGSCCRLCLVEKYRDKHPRAPPSGPSAYLWIGILAALMPVSEIQSSVALLADRPVDIPTITCHPTSVGSLGIHEEYFSYVAAFIQVLSFGTHAPHERPAYILTRTSSYLHARKHGFAIEGGEPSSR